MMMCLGLLGSKGRRRGERENIFEFLIAKRGAMLTEAFIPPTPPCRWQCYTKWQILMTPKQAELI